jgi:hypothetical protein
VKVTARCGLTPRSSGAPTAGRQARAGGTRYIFTSPALASCRWRPLSSNVRPQHEPQTPHRASGNSARSVPVAEGLLKLDAWSARVRKRSCHAKQPSPQGRFAPPCCAGQSARLAPPCRPDYRRTAPTAWKSKPKAKPQLRCRHRRFQAWLSLVYKQRMSVTSQEPRPNLSLNRSANGVPPGPRGSCGSSSASRPRRHTAVARLALR